jgi:hypothetical protein
MELLWNLPRSKMSKMEAKMEVKPEAFPHLYYIKKPILANRLFSLFAELLRTQSKVPGFELQYFFIL